MFLILALAIAGFSLHAQKGKVDLKLVLRDGNVVSGTSTSISTVTLVTDYGKLEIPIKNVSSLKFGITPDESSKSAVIKLIKEMDNSEADKRKAAYDELVAMSVNCIPLVSDYIYGEDYKAADYSDYTPETALAEMKTTYGVEDDYSEKDVVSIDYEYTIGGIFSLKTIALKTDYGDLTIPKEKIKEVEVTYYDVSAGDKTFKVLASKYISGNSNGGWLNTGIKVKNGQKISITASGEVVLESLSGNKYTPDGTSGTDSENNEQSTYPSYGNLVYRIGEFGEVTKAGSKYAGIAKESGTIFLSIYESVYNPTNTGFYSAKVTVK